MLKLNDDLGFGDMANFSLKLNILLDKQATMKILVRNKICIDKEAWEFLNNTVRVGIIDNGLMEQDYRSIGVVNYKSK